MEKVIIYLLVKAVTGPIIASIVAVFAYYMTGIINLSGRDMKNLAKLLWLVLGVGLLNILYLREIAENIVIRELIFIVGDAAVTLLLFQLEGGDKMPDDF